MLALAARADADVTPGPRLNRPAPMPPVALRVRAVSPVTEIETWLRDPYAIYAKHVLRLKPLDALDDAVGPAGAGHRIFHQVHWKFSSSAIEGESAGQCAGPEMIALADSLFAEGEHTPRRSGLCGGRVSCQCGTLVSSRMNRSAGGAGSSPPRIWKCRGTDAFRRPRRTVRTGLHCRSHRSADKAAKRGDHRLQDRQPRPAPSNGWCSLLTPQLPLEGAILAAGGFDGLAAQAADPGPHLSAVSPAKKSDREGRIHRRRVGRGREGSGRWPATPYRLVRRRTVHALSFPGRAAESRRHRRRLRSSGAGARMVVFGLDARRT